MHYLDYRPNDHTGYLSSFSLSIVAAIVEKHQGVISLEESGASQSLSYIKLVLP